MQQNTENTPIKRMASLLRQGATLTDLSCPVCSSPLFRLKDGTLWCAKDEKKVIVVKEGEEPPKQATAQASTAYDKLEATLLAKTQEIEGKIEKTQDIEELQKLTLALSELLNSLEKIKKMKAWEANLALGFYQNFPTNIHRVEVFNSTLSGKQLQQKLIQVLHEANRREFSFEEVANPTVPEGKVLFEFGLAEAESFNFIDEAELKRALNVLAKGRLHCLDFFCSIRYYKGGGEKKSALKFDYYMLRTLFSKDTFEVQVFHERGPRYLSPEDLTMFIFSRINEPSNRKVLKRTTV